MNRVRFSSPRLTQFQLFRCASEHTVHSGATDSLKNQYKSLETSVKTIVA